MSGSGFQRDRQDLRLVGHSRNPEMLAAPAIAYGCSERLHTFSSRTMGPWRTHLPLT